MKLHVVLFYRDVPDDGLEYIYEIPELVHISESPNDYIYKHPHPDTLQFYSYLVYRKQLLEPEFKEALNKDDYYWFKTDQPFYKFYLDSYLDFCKKLESNPQTKKIDPEIYKQPEDIKNPGTIWVKISKVAVKEFIAISKETIFNHLAYLDPERSYIKLTSNRGFDKSDSEVFDKLVKERYKSNVLNPILPINIQFKIEYVTIKKVIDPEKKTVIDKIFRDLDMKAAKFNLFDQQLLERKTPGEKKKIDLNELPIENVSKIVEKIEETIIIKEEKE
jgi:hypothetical protein